MAGRFPRAICRLGILRLGRSCLVETMAAATLWSQRSQRVWVARATVTSACIELLISVPCRLGGRIAFLGCATWTRCTNTRPKGLVIRGRKWRFRLTRLIGFRNALVSETAPRTVAAGDHRASVKRRAECHFQPLCRLHTRCHWSSVVPVLQWTIGRWISGRVRRQGCSRRGRRQSKWKIFGIRTRVNVQSLSGSALPMRLCRSHLSQNRRVGHRLSISRLTIHVLRRAFRKVLHVAHTGTRGSSLWSVTLRRG